MGRVFAWLFCFGAAACANPAEPSEGVIFAGRWEGTYSINGAEPANCGSLAGCPANPALTLTLDQAGDDLSGILQLGPANEQGSGRFAVKGRVSDDNHVTLSSDPVPVAIPCTGRPTAHGETQLVEWSTQLTGRNLMDGMFTSQEFRLFNVGGTNLCPTGIVRIRAEGVRLTRRNGT
jgi:hypothetical protein